MDIDTTDAGTTELHRLLDEELAFSPSFQGMYSNHLAMALVALHRMGAPSEVLHATFAAHAAGEAEPRDDRDVLDDRLAEVARDGIAATVRTRARDLVGGPGSQLFHPLIRLGYGLDVDHGGQVAAALLDWERRYAPLAVPLPRPGSRRLADVAADLAARPAATWPRGWDLDGIAARPELRDTLVGVSLDERTLDDVSGFALAAHVAADAFVTLHMVTGARALRTVAGWLDEDDAAALVAHAVPVMAVAFVAAGAVPLLPASDLDELRSTPLPARAPIAARAVADHDPHVIKLAEVALAEEARTGDPLYRYLAARVVGLAPSVDELLGATRDREVARPA
jgi:hypothetical protein